MIDRKILISDPAGLHLRPAGELCNKALEYDSKIMICFRNREFNAKSLLSVLSACVQQLDEIHLVCSGTDEEQAAKELGDFLEQGMKQL